MRTPDYYRTLQNGSRAEAFRERTQNGGSYWRLFVRLSSGTPVFLENLRSVAAAVARCDGIAADDALYHSNYGGCDR